jgi:hypothetical protein
MFPRNSRNALVGFDSWRETSVTSKTVRAGDSGLAVLANDYSQRRSRHGGRRPEPSGYKARNIRVVALIPSGRTARTLPKRGP